MQITGVKIKLINTFINMIKYKLICKSCKSSFDSWFASSNDYEKLKKLKYINCQNCNSLKVRKKFNGT